MRTLARCRLITEPTARLACFDAAAAQLQDAVSTGQVTMLDREGVRQTKRSLFGFTLPRVGLFGRSDGEPEFTEIDTTIARVLPLGFGKYELMLKDGARWQTTDALASPPRSGSAVRIRKATLGSYFINVNGRRGVKGRRIG
ncbi:hypothetical protein [uncultured Sphingomonas sp.]|uniref:hypothetical protein n=1 Tax=uncultured Sphingomonas sp. TaxID=158754 RepID=UPI0035CB29B6